MQDYKKYLKSEAKKHNKRIDYYNKKYKGNAYVGEKIPLKYIDKYIKNKRDAKVVENMLKGSTSQNMKLTKTGSMTLYAKNEIIKAKKRSTKVDTEITVGGIKTGVKGNTNKGKKYKKRSEEKKNGERKKNNQKNISSKGAKILGKTLFNQSFPNKTNIQFQSNYIASLKTVYGDKSLKLRKIISEMDNKQFIQFYEQEALITPDFQYSRGDIPEDLMFLETLFSTFITVL